MMDRLNYVSTEQMYEGIIVEVYDASVVIDLKGRLGQINIPRRMIISKWDLEVGQEVGFLMSYPEVLDEDPNQDYVSMVRRQEARRIERMKKEEKGE